MRITVSPHPALCFRGWVPADTDVPALLRRIEALCAAGLSPEDAVRVAWPPL